MTAPGEAEIRTIGEQLAAGMPSPWRSPAGIADRLVMRRATADPRLQAALFRFVDVAPACADRQDLAAHLASLLGEVSDPPEPVRQAIAVAQRPRGRALLGAAASVGVRQMARRFILAPTPAAAGGALGRLWRAGAAPSLDLLGEAAVSADEADAYAQSCLGALRELTRIAAGWPVRPRLDRDALGKIPRANLAVKVSALTPRLRPEAPHLGQADAIKRLRPILRCARDLGAHVQIDMESLDDHETISSVAYELLGDLEFRDGPSIGIVVQAYLTDSPAQLDQVIAFARSCKRSSPLTVRLVKGAYWDHELVLAQQHGWPVPVFQSRTETDRNFELLSARLLRARPQVRVAIASHNLRSVAHAIATSRALGADDGELEVQVLRGLGDDLRHSLASQGLRVRSYCPVGGLVAGMAYLVRRLLENSSQSSFLHAQASGVALDALLAPP